MMKYLIQRCVNTFFKILRQYGGLIFLFWLSSGNGFSELCDFSGMTAYPELAIQYEFPSLLKDIDDPGYYPIQIIGRIAIEDPLTLISPLCNVSEYTKYLLYFYQTNQAAIRTKNKNIADVLDFIKLRLQKLQPPQTIAQEKHEEL